MDSIIRLQRRVGIYRTPSAGRRRPLAVRRRHLLESRAARMRRDSTPAELYAYYLLAYVLRQRVRLQEALG